MKQLFQIFFISLACIGFTAPAYAFKISPSASKNLVLFTITSTTSDGKAHEESVIDTIYAGRARTAPCSDLTVWASDTGPSSIVAETEFVSANDLLQYPGPGYSCIREDITFNGKTYSTGNITLNWNASNNAYIDANPKQITINYDTN